jgi:4-amino-4-deoxy-L-arabinose transferase-like glycosyltransferase
MHGDAPPLESAAVALLGALLFLPGLGSVGLVDPWEPHYAEVARQMLVRSDWVHPWWREAGFFSKPPLVLWGGAAGMALLGPAAVEWGVRLPVALLCIGGAAFAAVAVSRLASRRAGLLAGTALVTAPFLALFARQALPDGPLAALSTAGGLALAVSLLDDRAGPGWAAGGWVLLGWATLAKGPIGLALPAAALLGWLVVTGEWRRAPRLLAVVRVVGVPVPIGPVAFLAVAVPWYAAMAAWPVRDESGWTFLQRFWLHDHLRRLTSGAHVPVDGGGFTAYLGWIAVGTFPWVAALPGGLAAALRWRAGARDGAAGLALLCGLWALLGLLLFGFAATSYPHYVLPVVPPLLVLAALFLDRLVDEGLGSHAVAGILGAAAFVATGRALLRTPRAFTTLFTYDPRRAFPPGIDPGPALTVIGGLGLLGLALAAVRRSGRGAAWTLAGVALALAAWLSWAHWREVVPHWSQRDAFATLRAERPAPDEVVVAWRMNWRGETFYGRNEVREVLDPARMREVASRPGRLWVITEEARIPALAGAVGAAKRLRVAGPPSGRYRVVELSDAPATKGASP